MPMFLSQLILNIRNGAALRDLRNPYEMHRTIWNSFPALRVSERDSGRKEYFDRILFRVDTDHANQATVIVQSDIKPDWTKLLPDYLRVAAESKPLDPQLSVGQRLRFRLRANPTKRLREKSRVGAGQQVAAERIGDRVGLLSEEQQIRWLLRKADAGGFTIPGAWVKANDPETNAPIEIPNFRVDAIPEARVRWERKGEQTRGTFNAVRFEGILIVADVAKFRATIEDGIGSAKGFGFGMLSVAPA
jgi:CRISPR system Cascade subunit CasE